MKLSIQGNRLYVDNLMFSHCEVKDGHGDKSFSGEVEPRYAHSVGRELLHVDGLGWLALLLSAQSAWAAWSVAMARLCHAASQKQD